MSYVLYTTDQICQKDIGLEIRGGAEIGKYYITFGLIWSKLR